MTISLARQTVGRCKQPWIDRILLEVSAESFRETLRAFGYSNAKPSIVNLKVGAPQESKPRATERMVVGNSPAVCH